MKKSIIVLALALLMVGSVFAANKPLTAQDSTTDGNSTTVIPTAGISTNASTEPKDTTVKIKLAQYPKYMAAITTTEYSTSGNKIANASGSTGTVYSAVKHEEVITLSVNKDTWKLAGPNTTYYYTYYAYENTQNVQYSITMNGNLKYQDNGNVGTGDTEAPTWSGDSTSAVATKQKEIRYQITIGSDTIYSFGTDSGTLKNTVVVKQIPLTKLIGKSTYGSLAMTFAGYSTDTVQYNIVGSYLATVTIKVSAY